MFIVNEENVTCKQFRAKWRTLRESLRMFVPPSSGDLVFLLESPDDDWIWDFEDDDISEDDSLWEDDMIGEETTKLVLEEQSETRTFEFSYSLSTTELVQEMYLLCLAGGHDKDNVAGAMFELGSQLTEDYDNG